MSYDTHDYTFEGLVGPGIGGSTSLAYLVSLVDSPHHRVLEPIIARGILAWLFDEEEQLESAAELVLSQEEFFHKLFPMRFYPQTPVMLTQQWSPIGAMLERGLEPLVLCRNDKARAVASGIWNVTQLNSTTQIENCETVEQLFWAVVDRAFYRAKQRRMLVNIIAKPGWNYDTNISSLPKWPANEVALADRILWKRTPED
jgi:hypothetical protein